MSMNTRITKVLYLAIALLLTVMMPACTSFDTPESQEPQETTARVDKAIIGAADNFMNLVYPATRGANRQVKNVRHMLSALTRGSASQDTLFTVVNYEDESGFVLMAKTENGYDLYAIDDSHSMEFTDTTFNEGLRFYLSQARANAFPGTGTDSTIVAPPITSETYEVVKHGPFLNNYVSNWSQRFPYNIFCPVAYNSATGQYDNCLTGCVPLAMAMVMAYHHWPLTASNHGFDWVIINGNPNTFIPSYAKYAYEEIATLVTMLGNSDNLKTTYGLYGSSTPLRNIVPVLNKWGFTHSGDWNKSTAADLARQNTPALMFGEEDSNNLDASHVWVCDGRMYLKYNSDSGLVDDTDYVPRMYYHFVWGWGGRSNGYYRIGSKTGVDGDPITGNTVETPNLFVHLKCLTDIKPIK